MPGTFVGAGSEASVSRNFARSQRLLSAGDYKAVFDRADFRVSHRHFLLLARLNSRIQSRLGLIVAKKHLRRAVDRNRVKRVVRNTYRLSSVAGQGVDVVFLARRGVGELSPGMQTRALQEAWQTLFNKISSSGAGRETNSAASMGDISC